MSKSMLPVFFNICERKRFPLARYFISKSLMILEEIVPFPDPGAPIMTALRSLAAILNPTITCGKLSTSPGLINNKL